ncbi:MAG: type II toxin-antitoxin system VapC family toxin [Acidobacteria bacterium]|nr:type II toxin-antitoxin system VapC family toxin [Acidobacteriota bacterium]
MTVYLDTSVVLRALLDTEDAVPGWGGWDRAYTSELMGVEARRVFDRLRLERALDDHALAAAHGALAATERAVGLIRLTRVVLRRAGLPLPTSVKTLDAIHLASALLLAEQRENGLAFGTCDRRQATAARALGFDVVWAPSGSDDVPRP